PPAIDALASARPRIDLSPFDLPDSPGRKVIHAGVSAGRNFAEERADPKVNVFEHAARHIAELRTNGRVVVAGWTEGSIDRLAQILGEHGLANLKRIHSLQQLTDLPKGAAGLAVLRVEAG